MKKFYIVGLSILCSITIVAALHFYTNRNAERNNGFDRRFSAEKVTLKGKVTLGSELYSIADITRDSIKLYNYRKPNQLFFLTSNLERKNIITLPVPEKEEFKGMNAVAFIDTNIFLMSGFTSNAFKIFPDRKIERHRLDSLPFYQSELVSTNSFIFISKIKHQGDFRRKLIKSDLYGKELTSYLFDKQLDGYFCTDGQFKYDRNSKLLVYMYYYRGVLICLDTNLNVLYSVKTIDTVNNAKIHLKPIKGKFTHAAPPALVNKRCCIAGERIYINSNLKADNQNINDFTNAETIDVYDLKKGTYIVSFYLPKADKQKLTEFRVYEGTLTALYKNTVAIFNIPTS